MYSRRFVYRIRRLFRRVALLPKRHRTSEPEKCRIATEFLVCVQQGFLSSTQFHKEISARENLICYNQEKISSPRRETVPTNQRGKFANSITEPERKSDAWAIDSHLLCEKVKNHHHASDDINSSSEAAQTKICDNASYFKRPFLALKNIFSTNKAYDRPLALSRLQRIVSEEDSCRQDEKEKPVAFARPNSPQTTFDFVKNKCNSSKHKNVKESSQVDKVTWSSEWESAKRAITKMEVDRALFRKQQIWTSKDWDELDRPPIQRNNIQEANVPSGSQQHKGSANVRLIEAPLAPETKSGLDSISQLDKKIQSRGKWSAFHSPMLQMKHEKRASTEADDFASYDSFEAAWEKAKQKLTEKEVDKVFSSCVEEAPTSHNFHPFQKSPSFHMLRATNPFYA